MDHHSTLISMQTNQRAREYRKALELAEMQSQGQLPRAHLAWNHGVI